MVTLTVFRYIADSHMLLFLVLLLNCIALTGMHLISAQLVSGNDDDGRMMPPNGSILDLPDLRFTGYTADELHDFYKNLGVEGRQIYIQIENWDIFPYMLSYTLCLGTFLVIMARRIKKCGIIISSERFCYLSTLIWVCDMVETLIQRHGCIIYSDTNNNVLLPPKTVALASACVCLKWFLLGISVFLLITGGILCAVVGKLKTKSDTTRKRL